MLVPLISPTGFLGSRLAVAAGKTAGTLAASWVPIATAAAGVIGLARPKRYPDRLTPDLLWKWADDVDWLAREVARFKQEQQDQEDIQRLRKLVAALDAEVQQTLHSLSEVKPE